MHADVFYQKGYVQIHVTSLNFGK